MANPNLAIRVLAEPLRTLAFGAISGVYAGLGTALQHPARQIYIVNNSDVLLTFSLDGVNDHFVIPANSYFLDDISSNMTLPGGSLALSQGQRIYVKGAPTMGAVYLSVFYGSNS